MSAYTPAPWYALAEGVTDAAIGYRAIIDSDGYTVCNPSPMGEGNARLIAAAPDLLNALDGLLDYLRDYDADYPEAAPIFGKARSAIAKATGENA
jgi:hypothetical protein